MKLGTLIKEYRNRKGLEVTELSELTGLNINSLKKYERAGTDGGAFPPLDKLTRICAVLEIDPREVFAVSAEEDIDTSIFYKLDDRENTPKKINDTLESTNAILKRYGFAQIETEEELYNSSDDEAEKDLAGIPVYEAIRLAVDLVGIEGRCLPVLIREAREAFSVIEGLDLLSLLYSRSLVDEELDDMFHPTYIENLTLKERDIWCDNISEILITNALYSVYFSLLDEKSSVKLVAELGLDEQLTLFTGDTLIEVSRALNNAVENREPFLLFDEDQYSWVENLIAMSPLDDGGFIPPSELKAGMKLMRVHAKDGALLADDEINYTYKKSSEDALAASPSSKSTPTSKRKEGDDG